MATEFRERARRLRNAVEPVATGSPVAQDDVARPELKSYLTRRGACLEQVPGEVVAAAFGCVNPRAVIPFVAAGWQTTSRDAVLRIAGVHNVGGGPHFGSGLTIDTAVEHYPQPPSP